MTGSTVAKYTIKHKRTGKIIFEGDNPRGADLRNANLWGADLRDADLWGADLRNANLQDANLRNADLWGAQVWGANLQGADLRDANLRGANLRGADLRNADLRDANLRGANLRGAQVRDANLQNADLRCIGDGRYIKSMQLCQWNIAYTHDVLQIGCQRHPISEWTPELLERLAGTALNFIAPELNTNKKRLALLLKVIALEPASKPEEV